MRLKLRQIRKNKGYTQNQFAVKLGISRSHYSQIETGDKNPSLKLAMHIKSMLNYHNDNIFDDTSVDELTIDSATM